MRQAMRPDADLRYHDDVAHIRPDYLRRDGSHGVRLQEGIQGPLPTQEDALAY